MRIVGMGLILRRCTQILALTCGLATFDFSDMFLFSRSVRLLLTHIMWSMVSCFCMQIIFVLFAIELVIFNLRGQADLR